MNLPQPTKKIIAFHWCMLTCLFFSLQAQDPHFTQFYAAPLYMNPASAGNAVCDETPAGRATGQYRNQWSGRFNTLNLSWDQPFDFAHGGFGFQYVHDVAGSGLILSQSLAAYYSYAAELNDKFRLRIGLQAGMVNRSVDMNKIIFADQLDSLHSFDPNQPGYSSISYPTFAPGFLFSGKNFYVGGAVFNFNQPNWSFYQNPNEYQPRRITLHGGYTFQVKENLKITPQAQFMKQSLFRELLFGSNVSYKRFVAGAWFRQLFGNYNHSDAIAFTLGYESKTLRFMYSYDRTISAGRSAIPFSHEITLSYAWKTKQKHAAFSVPD